MPPNLNKKTEEQKHPWRLCPLGQHWVDVHMRKSDRGSKPVKGHCQKNPSRKDQIYADEIALISRDHFSDLGEMPTNDNLGYKYLGNRYDSLIAGWTKYWNEVLKPSEKLDSNLVKALIATESSFNREARIFAGERAGHARGLMQITDWALEILKDEKGELKDHLVNSSQKDMTVPSLNIAAGIRWLHRKKQTASAKLKREANWMEAAADYKSYLEEWRKNPDHRQMKKLQNFYERLKR